ncbi:MAG: TatD family hydrolase [bacterium]|nr:TatD family hydrolase [bacterium]MDA1024664.1 TatD family hydrolase [bacterium]
MQFIDTHCHVHFEAYKTDMDDVVQRALDGGVQMITVGTQTTTSKNGILLAERYEGVWATIGLHPNHVHKQAFFDENELPAEKQPTDEIKTRSETFDESYYRELVAHPKVVAIGEFGLDYYRLPEGQGPEQLIDDQKREAKKQIEFASQFNKPVVIHCRDAHADQFALLKAEIDQGGLTRRGVVHCFTGTAEDAERYASIGFKTSITGIVTFSKELQAVVKDIPLEQIMIETDSPYLTPAPNRGKRNEPLYVKDVAKVIADLKGVSLEEVAERTTETAKGLFLI